MASLPSKITTGDKSQEENYDASKLNAQDYNELKSKFNALIDYLRTGPTAVELDAPINFQVAALSSTSIGQSWNDTSNASGYEVQGAANLGFTIGVYGVYNGPLTNSANPGLTAGSTRYYRVRAIGTGNYLNSPWSVVKGTTTPAAQVTTFTGSYQAVLADYQSKCSVAPPAGYQYPSGSGTASTQSAADAAAKTDALSKITCPVVAPPQTVYDTTLTSANPEGGSINFASSNGHKISFNAIAGAAGSPADTVLVWNGQTSFATIPSEYLDKPFAFHDGNGTRHDTTAGGAPAKFIDGTITF